MTFFCARAKINVFMEKDLQHLQDAQTENTASADISADDISVTKTLQNEVDASLTTADVVSYAEKSQNDADTSVVSDNGDGNAENDSISDTPNTTENGAVSDIESTTENGDGIDGEFLLEKPEIVYHISDFDGPIPLLYELIKDAKIAIEDIFISQVTSQYVEIIKNTPREELDFDYAGEFITMAAELVYLKSIRTLPKEDEEITEDDPEYERMILINKIKEYAILQEQSEKLREIETINRFYRQPVYTDKDYRVALVNFSLPKLVEAFARVLANEEIHRQEIIPKKVVKDRFSVHEQMENIRLMISVRGSMKFTDLFEPDYDKSDIVTTFLAMLELLKYGKLRAEQDEVFGEITIYAVDGTEESIEFEEDDNGKY